MSLSKRHYEQFAQRIRQERANALSIIPGVKDAEIDGRLSALRNLAEALCIDFKLDNPRFDKARFLEACGFDAR